MRKFNYQFVLNGLGLLLMIEALFMLPSAFVGEYFNEDTSKSIYISVAVTFVFGAILFLLARKNKVKIKNITKREGYLTVTLAWVMMALFGTLPYLLSNAIPSFTNAFFESMCGFTTTGSSTLLNLEAFPKSLHLWRSFTQWIGGIGIIIFVMSFIPLFGGSANQLYDAEATGISEDYLRPRIKEIVRDMSITYIMLTVVGFLLLWAGPMNAFDAICHTFTSISTGGFSTKQASVAHFNSPYSEYVIIGLMFMGGTNFMLMYYLFRQFSPKIFKDEEFRWYLGIILTFTFIITVMLLFSGKMSGIENTFRTAFFQVVAAVTTTGFATYDFLTWGQLYWFLFLAMVLFCGSEGSTSGGMKVSRLVVLVKNSKIVFQRLVHPNALVMVKMDGKIMSNETVSKVLAFVFLYLTLVAISFIVLSSTGMTFDESIGVSISSMSSYGFGMGSYGPSGNFANATDFAKYYVCFLMLVARLEIFTVLALFLPGFWKR